MDECSGVGLEGWRVGGWTGILWRVEGLDNWTSRRLDGCSGGGLEAVCDKYNFQAQIQIQIYFGQLIFVNTNTNIFG